MTAFKQLIITSFLSLAAFQGQAQEAISSASTRTLTQKVRGQVTDAESKQPLAGVVIYLGSDPQINATTDDKGYFSLEQVPVGRQSFQFSLVGFENYSVSEAMVISGKELELNVNLKQSLRELEAVTVTAVKDRTKASNEFATLSSRSISVEETRRYAAAFSDPARMAQNFPGVSNNGDGDNSIVVRGNSPKGVLWRLEGIEIPNPNHFSGLGSTGGAISMLNANVLGNSDFYTGAFPADIGNALSGAFDLNFRNGNTDRREHTVQFGALGIELATEGPFSKNSKASYLFNYRYSTLALLGRFLDLGGVQPEYQDASFKLNLPTKKAGTFSVFGLGGYNQATHDVEADSSKWDDEENFNVKFISKTQMGVAGVSHQYFLTKNSYIRSIVSASYDKASERADTLDPGNSYAMVPITRTSASNTAYRMSVMYNNKLSAKNTFRAGVIAQQLAFDMDYNIYDEVDNRWEQVLQSDGNTQLYEGYVQYKTRLTEKLTLTGGLHASYFALNSKYAIEPRVTAAYETGRHRFTLAAGLHSKPEHISTYLYKNQDQNDPAALPNKDLDLSRAFHAVGGYGISLPWQLKLKTEIYYQHLYSVGVERDTASRFSMINAESAFALLETRSPLVSDGTGQNYGIDISLERPFMNNYYVLATGSVFKSTFKAYNGETYNTRFDRGYQANLIGGKEFKLSANGKRLLGLNGKVLFSGGLRESKIDLEKSITSGETEIVPGHYFTERGKAYFRADIGVYYKFNSKKATHSIQFDVQNVTNNKNYYMSYFDREAGKIKTANQLGFFPNISYRVDFHW